MKSRAQSAMPLSVRRSLVKLGSDLNIARRKRRMALEEVAQAAAISRGTLQRLERGDPSVSLGIFAMVLLALGEQRRLAELIDSARDEAGLTLDEARLPKRVRRKDGVRTPL